MKRPPCSPTILLWVLLLTPLLWSCEKISPAGPPSDPLGGLIYAISKSESKEVPSQAELDEVETAKIIFSALRPSAYATVELLHVTTGGDDAHDGTSWGKAKKTIQSALDAVTTYKVSLILVGSGTYTPKATLSMKNRVAIIGGFEASGSYEKGNGSTISGEDTRRVFQNLDMDIGGGGIRLSNAVLARVTVSRGSSTEGGGMANYNSSPTLTQVTFSGNTATEHGGGIYNSNSILTLTAVTFSGNSAGKNGGGMANDRSSLTLTDVTFSGNSAGKNGGGMANDISSLTLTDVTFSGNTSSFDGGGMYNDPFSSMRLTAVTFSDNTAGEDGGGMYNDDSYLTLTSVTFSDNEATYDGGGMYNKSSSSLTLTAVTFSGNSAGENGGGMANDSLSLSSSLTAVTFSGNFAGKNGGGMANDSSSPTLIAVTFSNNSAVEGGGMYNSNSSPTIAGAIFWRNTKGAANTPDQIVNVDNSTPIIAHSIVQGGYAGGTAILTTDPNLSALADNGGFVQTQAIRAGSPAIDTGLYFARSGSTNYYYSTDNTTWYATPLLTSTAATPPAGATRYTTDARGYSYSGRPDMGAYESGGTAPATP